MKPFKIILFNLVFIIASFYVSAEDGHELWLRKKIPVPVNVICEKNSPTLNIAIQELQQGWQGKPAASITLTIKKDNAIKADGFKLTQNAVQAKSANPDITIDVVGQKWSWTFNYKSANNPAVGQDVWEAGTINKTPDLYVPVGKLIQFNLSSPDVIHSFWVPSFYEKLDVIPGRHNSLQMTPTTEGVFAGRCAELCGTYHSAMLFNVHIVSENDYNAYLKTLVAKGQIGEAKGPAWANSAAKTGSEEGTR